MNKQGMMKLIRTAALAAMAAIPGMCCTFSISVPAIGSGGGVVPVYVSTQAGCPWQVTHSAGWMSNYGGSTGYGPGVIYVYVAPDYGAARSTPVHIVVTPNTGTIGGRSGSQPYVAASATAVQY
jgi:hypothetical protein